MMLAAHPDRHVFADAKDLSSGTAYCYSRKEMVTVPNPKLILAGIRCNAVSALNNYRQQYRDTIKRRAGGTGETWGHLFDYVFSAKRPCS